MSLYLYISVLVIFPALVLGTAVGISMYLSDSKEKSEQPRRVAVLRDLLSKSLSQREPSWDRIKILAESEDGYPHLLRLALESLIVQCEVSGQSEGDIVADRAATLLKILEENEPFDDLPEELKLHLENLQEKLSGDREQSLRPLAKHLRGLLELHSISKKRQVLITYLGLGSGLVGLLFAALQYFKD